MTRILAMLIALAMLSACFGGGGGGGGSNPLSRGAAAAEDADSGGTGGGTGTGTDGDTDEETARIPTEIAKNLTAVRFDAASGTLIVEGINLDDTPYEAVYTASTAIAPVPGFTVYTKQDDSLDRHATAYTGQAATGARSTVVATGGPYNEYFTGVYYETTGAYSAPAVTDTTGLVSYVGQYVGLLNVSGSGEDLIPAGAVPDEIRPTQAAETTGTVFMNSDFADNRIEGNIYNREIRDTGESLPSIVLVNTEVTEAGAFTGTVEYSLAQTDTFWQGIDDTTIGSYAGEIDGAGGQSIVGGIQLDQIDGPGNQRGLENELEWGVFVLEKCGTAAASSPLCSQVNP